MASQTTGHSIIYQQLVFRLTSETISKIRIIGPLWGVGTAENFSMSWCHRIWRISIVKVASLATKFIGFYNVLPTPSNGMLETPWSQLDMYGGFRRIKSQWNLLKNFIRKFQNNSIHPLEFIDFDGTAILVSRETSQPLKCVDRIIPSYSVIFLISTTEEIGNLKSCIAMYMKMFIDNFLKWKCLVYHLYE